MHPHLYANANKACGIEANANKCQKVACSVCSSHKRPSKHSTDYSLAARMNVHSHQAVFTSEREQNANAACENDANVRCRHIPEVRQTAFGCAMNVRQTAECYLPNVGTSKEIRIRYV